MELRPYLKRAKLTLAQFAGIVGSSQPSLTRYTRGDRPMPIDLADRIVRETGGKVRLKDLFAPRRRFLERRG